ncbi:nitric oxide synthase, salivary gland-like [Penaeus monodon]|uniref:nitric oxide synthase, salivary gland-like n=1 Tax=Penaeus monodon TaxID=6687 RepID=UPI0018A73B8C|nr:nitric oxide synthase, salivary gland-like [Penaeus monodon]
MPPVPRPNVAFASRPLEKAGTFSDFFSSNQSSEAASLDAGSETRLVSLDFSSAFEVINHKALLFKLKSVAINGPFYILSDFLLERQQRVAIDGEEAAFCSASAPDGVEQEAGSRVQGFPRRMQFSCKEVFEILTTYGRESSPGMVKKACPVAPQRLTNFSLKKEVVDTLQIQTKEAGVCSGSVCGGSLMNIRRMSLAPRSPALVLAHAKSFLDQYYQDIQGYDSAEHKARWQEVSRSVARRGTYDLTFDELVFGAKLAWRNAPRCIGRMQWKRLQVFDARHIMTAKEMFEAICTHIEYATDGGNLRSTLTVFPQRLSGRRDFRVWNPQLIAYAGYRNDDGSVTGDPAWAEFTQVCQELGWQGGGGRFDILPLVVSTPTEEPQWFDIPDDLVLRVALEHPKYDWFRELGLEWFALPAVSGMMLDCGGVEFTAAPFNGWYLSSEIASRDLCDAQRYNIIKEVGDKLGLDTRTPVTLWKDQAALEVNIAVLHSYQQAKVTLVDHHTVSESFMQFFANEHRERGGCPADWVWIVPPISGSLTPVFHQEMSLYYLKPAYEYQELAWVAFAKQNRMLSGEDGGLGGDKQRLSFRMVALAAWFSSVLYTRALSRRVRATILYATETGKSQAFAHELADVFRSNFSVQVSCMKEYEASALKDERFLLVVAPTAGNGDPPLRLIGLPNF